MKTGFLTLHTHPDHKGLVRVKIWDRLPELKTQADGSEIRYLARFRDIEAGRMHVQNAMHGALVDVEDRIYRQALDEMIACVEADYLEHSRIWIDPELDQETTKHIAELVEQHQSEQKWIDLVWRGVGIAGIILLVITALRL